MLCLPASQANKVVIEWATRLRTSLATLPEAFDNLMCSLSNQLADLLGDDEQGVTRRHEADLESHPASTVRGQSAQESKLGVLWPWWRRGVRDVIRQQLSDRLQAL